MLGGEDAQIAGRTRAPVGLESSVVASDPRFTDPHRVLRWDAEVETNRRRFRFPLSAFRFSSHLYTQRRRATKDPLGKRYSARLPPMIHSKPEEQP